MGKTSELDEIEVIDLEEYNYKGKLLPKRIKYYLIRVDDEKIRVQSPIRSKEILASVGLDPDDYRVIQVFRGGRTLELEPEQSVDLREPGVEHFEAELRCSTQIIINGREKLVTDKRLTFEEVIQLAFDNPPQGTNVCFTVTFRNGPSKRPEGTMVEGDSVKVKKGMIFNVTATDKS